MDLMEVLKMRSLSIAGSFESPKRSILYNTWCLLNVNDISDLIKNAWRTTKKVIQDMHLLNLSNVNDCLVAWNNNT